MTNKHFSIRDALRESFVLFKSNLLFILSFTLVGGVCLLTALWCSDLMYAQFRYQIASKSLLGVIVLGVMALVQVLIETFIRLSILCMCFDLSFHRVRSYYGLIRAYFHFLSYVVGKVLLSTIFAICFVASLIVIVLIGYLSGFSREPLIAVTVILMVMTMALVISAYGFFDLFIIDKHYLPYNALKASAYLTKGVRWYLIILILMEFAISSSIAITISLISGGQSTISYQPIFGSLVLGEEAFAAIVVRVIMFLIIQPYIDLVHVYIYRKLLDQTTAFWTTSSMPQ